MSHWLGKIIELLSADTADLRELALIAGGNPLVFYRGIDPKDLDLSGQDLRGIEFKNVNQDYINIIKQKQPKEQRLCMLLDSIIQNRSSGLKIIEMYGQSNSGYEHLSIGELYRALSLELETKKVDNISLVRAMRRPLSHQLGKSRVQLLYYMAKYLAKYPEINTYIRKSWAKSTSRDFDSYRHEIESFLVQK